MPDFKYIKEDDKGTVTIAPETTTPPTPPLHVTLNVEGTVNVTENLTVKGKINEGQTWYQVLPKNVIMMWYGDAKAPEGWAICDGSAYHTIQKESHITWHKTGEKLPDGWTECIDPNLKTTQTPDLRGRFVMGADNTLKKGDIGGSPSMIKQANIAGSGLDMSKAGYISEIDYPPYMALYYIMKL